MKKDIKETPASTEEPSLEEPSSEREPVESEPVESDGAIDPFITLSSILSIILSLLGLILVFKLNEIGVVLPPLALGLALISRKQLKKNEQLEGQRLAQVALVASVISILLTILLLLSIISVLSPKGA